MYKVEKIIDKRQCSKRKGKFQYKVKWEGWGQDNCTWEPERHLQYVKNLIQEFEGTQTKEPDHNQCKSGTDMKHQLETLNSLANMLQASSTAGGQIEGIKQNPSDEKIEVKSRRRNSEKPEQETKEIEEKPIASKTRRSTRTKKNYNESGKGNKNETDLSTEHAERTNQKINLIPGLIGGKDFVIVGMRVIQQQFWYYVSVGDQFEWIPRSEVIRQNPVKLCEFYESKIIFGS